MATKLSDETRQPGSEERPPIRVVVAEDSYPIREFLTTTLSSAPEVGPFRRELVGGRLDVRKP